MNPLKFLNKLKNDQRGEIGMFLILPIIIIVSLVVVSVLGSALIPTAVTSASNTSAISGFGTWSSGTQNMFTAIPTFITLDYLFVYVIILLVAIGIISKIV